MELSDHYTLGELLKKLDVPEGHKVILNNRDISPDTCDPYEKIYENYIIDIVKDKSSDEDKKEHVSSNPEEKDEGSAALKD